MNCQEKTSRKFELKSVWKITATNCLIKIVLLPFVDNVVAVRFLISMLSCHIHCAFEKQTKSEIFYRFRVSSKQRKCSRIHLFFTVVTITIIIIIVIIIIIKWKWQTIFPTPLFAWRFAVFLPTTDDIVLWASKAIRKYAQNGVNNNGNSNSRTA